MSELERVLDTRPRSSDRGIFFGAPNMTIPNRRMRTRMSGGVGAEQRSPTAGPYPDWVCGSLDGSGRGGCAPGYEAADGDRDEPLRRASLVIRV